MNFNKYINISLILFAFSIPISRAGIVFFSALLILLWILEGDFKNKFLIIKESNVVKLLAIFIVYYFVSLLWSEDLYEGFDYALKFWYLLPLVVIFTSAKKEYLGYIISAFLLAMLISEVISYGIFFQWWEFKGRLPSDPTPFMNHLQYSMFLAFTALLLLNRVFTEKVNFFKFWYFTYFLTVCANLFMNGGRTGQVAFIVSIFVVGFLNVKNKFKAFISMFILIMTIVFTAYTFSPNFEHRADKMIYEIEQTFVKKDFCSSVGSRFGFWIVGADILMDNPIIGVGVSDAMTEFREYVAKDYPYKKCISHYPNLHNDLIQILVQLGIVGGLIYILIFYNIFKINIHDYRYKNLPIIFVSVYVISSMFENMIHQQFSMALFSLFVGIFIASNKFNKCELK